MGRAAPAPAALCHQVSPCLFLPASKLPTTFGRYFLFTSVRLASVLYTTRLVCPHDPPRYQQYSVHSTKTAVCVVVLILSDRIFAQCACGIFCPSFII